MEFHSKSHTSLCNDLLSLLKYTFNSTPYFYKIFCLLKMKVKGRHLRSRIMFTRYLKSFDKYENFGIRLYAVI